MSSNDQLRCGRLAFIQRSVDKRTITAITIDARIPEILIDRYIGRHPETLVEGFTALIKPSGCEWMCDSRIVAIINDGSGYGRDWVLIELEPAK